MSRTTATELRGSTDKKQEARRPESSKRGRGDDGYRRRWSHLEGAMGGVPLAWGPDGLARDGNLRLAPVRFKRCDGSFPIET